MRTSNKILIGIAAAAVVVVAAIVIVARLLLGSMVTVTPGGGAVTIRPSGNEITKSYDLSGFDAISATGAWDISVNKGDTYAVEVVVPENVEQRLDVHSSGGSLTIGLKPGTTLTDWRLKASVTMPSLNAISLSGANRARLTGFSGDQLRVSCSGAATVSGSGGGYKAMEIRGSGAASVDFHGLPAVKANVVMSGAGQARLEMQGGALTGRLSGAAKVVYGGSVSTQSIKTSGIGNVSHQ